MPQLLVTVGTDGLTDWVKLPNGSKLSLGPVSVLQFVTKLSLSKRTARLALDSYLAGKSVMFSVEDDRMWELLAPRRARWASEGEGSFMPLDQRTYLTGKETTNMISKSLDALEKHIDLLNKHASTVSQTELTKGHGILVKLAHRVAIQQSEDPAVRQANEVSADVRTKPSELSNYIYRMGTAPNTRDSEGGTCVLAFDTIEANKDLAESIITAGEETVAKIDELSAAGKRFAADRAKTDVHAVTSKVAKILQSAEMTEAWVGPDLQKLSTQINHLHGLFLPTETS